MWLPSAEYSRTSLEPPLATANEPSLSRLIPRTRKNS